MRDHIAPDLGTSARLQDGRPAASYSLARRVLDRFTPWQQSRYPGKWVIWAAATPGYALSTVLRWRRSGRAANADALEHWASLLEARIEGDRAIAAECRAEAVRLRAQPTVLKGFLRRPAA